MDVQPVEPSTLSLINDDEWILRNTVFPCVPDMEVAMHRRQRQNVTWNAWNRIIWMFPDLVSCKLTALQPAGGLQEIC